MPEAGRTVRAPRRGQWAAGEMDDGFFCEEPAWHDDTYVCDASMSKLMLVTRATVSASGLHKFKLKAKVSW